MAREADEAKVSERLPLSAEEQALLEKATLTDRAIQAHPPAYFTAMRKGDPIHHDKGLNSWLVTRHEDIWAVQSDPITFSLNKGYHEIQARGMHDEFRNYLRTHGGGYFPDAIMSDPPYHTRIRKLMENAFTAHRVKELEPRIMAVVRDIVAGVADKGSCDAVKDIAIPITIRIIVEQLGLDQGIESRISRWSVAVTAQIGAMQSREQMLENAAQIADLQNYIELTTKPGMAELLESIVDDDRKLNRFIEEHMRNEPPVRALSRMCTKETVINGTTVPEGAHMLLVYASGNDDEAVFPEPRKFDIERPNLGRHVGFGGGPHRCIGVALARMEVKVAAREIVRQLKDIKLAIPEREIQYTPTVATHTIESLPISYSRR